MSNIRTFNWAYMAQVPDDVKLKFLASLAAAVTVSWIMGFRDKLEEFIFVHEFQIVLSGIEKMHFWTAKPYDTDFFLRIKPQLNMLTGNNNGWAVFTQYCLDTFKLLHEKGSHVSNITSTLFNGIHEKQIVEEFFTGNKGLMCTTPQPDALLYYATALQDTVSSLKGKLFKKITSFKIKT